MTSRNSRPRSKAAAASAQRTLERARSDLILGLSPFGRPDAGLVAAVTRAGAVGVLDAGGQRERARAELARVAGWASGSFGVRVTRDCELFPSDLEPLAGRVSPLILGADLRDDPETPWRAEDLAGQYHLLIEVTGVEAAREAVAAGAAGLIAVGCEAAGRVGELSSYVLLQRLVAEFGDIPVWVRGGVGTRMAVAAVVGGARGVVLDTQLSLLAEAEGELASGGGCRFDGETVVVAGYRVQVPPAARVTPAELEAMSSEDVLSRLRPAHSRLAFIQLGQDGFLATRFAKQFETVARAVRAVRAAVTAGLGAPGSPGTLPAMASTILAADSPLCQDLCLSRPVAQGPMTRVSDTPAFAKAVADDGALPFLALAMANQATATRLLHETKQSLGERPWGVGILGFAAPEVLAGQLEVIREVKPAAVIIAGGRPAQAESLEAEGIPAFLHVPSPTLLRQYLEAGARRFIFEGTECGGHVGPLASFPLWEAQLGVLTDYLDELGDDPGPAGACPQVLFAGGVHDARSAAMVAAAAAPLAARGVAVGLLMGTSYLFTQEAVECGAILPNFQQRMIEAENTTLLQSAPGHLTRCVPSPFVELFERTKLELRAKGTSGPDAWAELEALNVGRLRVAAKGVERRGDELVDVNVDHQLAEGLFMAGQVATLRRGVTTIARLHDSVTADAVRFLSESCESDSKSGPAAVVTSEPVPDPVDIAIVGMACVAPKSPDVATFWANVVAGVDAIEEVPASRWDPAIYYRADLGKNPSGEYTPSKWGGFLPLIPFDPLRYGIPPSALTSVEPVQFLALDVARKAMEDARLTPGRFDPSRTGVVFGTESNSDFFANIIMRGLLPAYYGEVPPELDEVLPKVTPDTFPGILANIIASRISNRFDLAGPAYVVDAACGSSLAALDLACKELVSGSADTVLCGGADLHAGIVDFLMFSSLGALSPTGKAKTFDASADGTTLAEAVACVVLKRLSDAERDGDRIYAVIKAVAGASDGRSLGLTAPRAEGQYLALRRTYSRAGISPREVGLVEAHGTGTTVGDRTELESLTRAYTEAGASVGGTQLGSVKSQIGHAKTAAGLIGLIKVSLSIYHGVRPPTLHVAEPNPAWDPNTSPFEFATTARPWAVPGSRRVAALSAFGFGGANYHAVVSGHSDDVPHRHGLDTWPSELFLFRGSDQEAARKAIQELERLLAVNDGAGRPWRLRDLARTAGEWADASSAPVRVAVVASDLDELAASLTAARTGDLRRGGIWFAPTIPAEPGQLAFLFPGQGSQRPGMLADLFVAFPEVQEYLRQGQRWADLVHPATAFGAERKAAVRAALTDTKVAQPALGIAGLTVHHLLTRLGITPDLVAGHSYGELVALSVAGAFDSETLLRLSAQRGAAILEAAAASGGDTGTMAAVRATSDQVREVLTTAGLTDQVVLANHNAPDQVVISGTTSGVAAAVAALSSAGHSAIPIEVACAFHSPLIASAVSRFAKKLADAPIYAPQLPVFSNRLAAAYPADALAVRSELAEQVGAPVRFVEQVEAMYEAGARVFVEAGPGRVLTRLVSAILADRPHTAVAVDGRRAGLNGLLDALAQLSVTGVVPRVGWLFRGRDAVDLTGAVPPRRPGWYIDGRAVVTADGQTPRGGLAPTRILQRPVPQPVASGNGGSGGNDALADDRKTAVVEFLRTSRDLVVQQRDVLLSYLGTPATGLSAPPPVAPMASAAPTAAAPMASAAPISTVVPARVASPVPGPRVSLQPPAAPPAGGVDVAGTVLEVICGSTGYPEDMIEPDLDLEADLSVDSIKRTEIAGILVARLGSSGRLEGGVAELTKLRSVRAITSWLVDRVGTQPAPALATGSAAPTGPAASPAGAGPASSPVDVAGTVLEVICGSTGYPEDMIEPDLDLEADLSVDSIKRTEIAGILVARLGSSGRLEGGVAELTKLRSVRAITSWLVDRVEPKGAPSAGESGPASDVAVRAPQPSGKAPTRYVTSYSPAPLDQTRATDQLAGRRIRIVTEPGTPAPVGAVAERLRALGAQVTETETSDGSWDVVYLGGWGEDDGTLALPEACDGIRSLLRGEPGVLLAVVPLAERAAGLRGMFRSIAREYPNQLTRVIEIDPGVAEAEVAEAVAGELADVASSPAAEPESGAMVCRYTPKGRDLLQLVASPLGNLATSGAGPGGAGRAEATAIGLTSESVVLLVGGARGITAGFTTLLASAAGCRLELVGRSAPPVGEEDPRTAAASDERQLRQALIGMGIRNPREVQKSVRNLLAEREIRETLASVASNGGTGRYHKADALDAGAVRKIVEQLLAEHGRLDGVVYAAGVIDDRLLAEKDAASFRRVFDTKVAGARSLLAMLADLTVRPEFVTLFGSIAAVAGNRGQSDYAAANDALETLGSAWSQRTGVRSLTVHWGPWAPSPAHQGMVSPSLEENFARRGIELIDQEEGHLALLRELAWGSRDQRAVVYTAGGWSTSASGDRS